MTLRTAGIAVLVAWMVGGPVVRQVIGDGHKWLPAWHMYRGIGLGLYEVRMTDGNGVRVDRLGALGHPDWTVAPMSVRKIKSREQLNRQIASVCAALPGIDLRVHARVARIRGWERVMDGQVDRCP